MDGVKVLSMKPVTFLNDAGDLTRMTEIRFQYDIGFIGEIRVNPDDVTPTIIEQKIRDYIERHTLG